MAATFFFFTIGLQVKNQSNKQTEDNCSFDRRRMSLVRLVNEKVI